MSYYRYPRSGYGDARAESAVGGIVLLIILAIVLIAYLTYKAIELLIRVFMRYPHIRTLWISLWSCVGLWIATGLSAWITSQTLPAEKATIITSIFAGLAVLATAILLITARVVELMHDQMAQRPITKETLVNDVLRNPWWNTSQLAEAS